MPNVCTMHSSGFGHYMCTLFFVIPVLTDNIESILVLSPIFYFLTYRSTGIQANQCPLTGVLMCITVLAGVGWVLHGGQQVGNFGPLRWSDVLSHVDDAVHCCFWIRLHKTEITDTVHKWHYSARTCITPGMNNELTWINLLFVGGGL